MFDKLISWLRPKPKAGLAWSQAPEARGRTGLAPEDGGPAYGEDEYGGVHSVGPTATVSVSAIVTRANGDVEDLGVISEQEL